MIQYLIDFETNWSGRYMQLRGEKIFFINDCPFHDANNDIIPARIKAYRKSYFCRPTAVSPHYFCEEESCNIKCDKRAEHKIISAAMLWTLFELYSKNLIYTNFQCNNLSWLFFKATSRHDAQKVVQHDLFWWEKFSSYRSQSKP